MADRIREYLNRLEGELRNQVEADRLAEILLEVEGHLRESEENYQQLGAPEDLAKRLALEEFGEANSSQTLLPRSNSLKSFLGWSLIFFICWVASLFFGFKLLSHGIAWVSYMGTCFVLGFFFSRHWKIALSGVLCTLVLTQLFGMTFFGATWHPTTGRPILEWRGEASRLSAQQYKSQLDGLHAQRNYILQMQEYWEGVRLREKRALPSDIDGKYLVMKEWDARLADSPNIESFKNSLPAQKIALNGINAKIQYISKLSTVTTAIQNSTWVERFGPVANFVGVYGAIFTLPLLVCGLGGAAIRRIWDYLRLVMKKRRGYAS